MTAQPDAGGRGAYTLLHLMWLASPALPVGAFSYAEGLESAVAAGRVHDETSAGDWLLDALLLAQARADLPVAAQAFAAWQQGDLERAAALNDWVRRTRESSELRRQSEQMGRSLCAWLANGGCGTEGGDSRVTALAALQPAPTWPIAFALAVALAGATARDALICMAFGWAENMVQAAMKAVPLGQAAAQRVLARIAAATPAAVDLALALGDRERQVATPMLAILSAQHELQYSRLFRS